MVTRILKLNELIREELSQIILRQLDFPKNILVTLTRVDTTDNLSVSKVYVSVLPDKEMEEAFNLLNRRIYEIQQFLNKRLKMRPIPKIVFKKEKETQKAAKVEEILEELKKE